MTIPNPMCEKIWIVLYWLYCIVLYFIVPFPCEAYLKTLKQDTHHSGTYAEKARLVCMRLLPVLGDFLSPPQLLSNLPSLLINISLTGPIRKVVLLYQSKRRDLSWNRLGDNIKKKMQWKVQYELSRSPFTQIPHLLYLPCESTLFPSSYF